MDGLNLINPEFDFTFAGTTYKVKKATLDKVILFQTKFAQLTEAKDPAIEKKMAAYCLYLVLKSVKADVTEEWVQENTPDVEFPDVVEQFGFLNRQKVEILREVLNRGIKKDSPVQEKQETPAGGQSST